MDYRDERDALRARLENLESELASAHAETERMRATENALAAAQRENEKLRAEVKRLAPKGAPQKSMAPVAAAVLAGTVVAGGVVMAVLVVSVRTRPESGVESPAQASPGATVVEGPAAAPEPQKSPRSTTVEWHARVVRSQGLPYPADAACTVRATLRSDGAGMQSTPEVEIACSGKSLYRSTDALAGVSNTSYRIEEAPGPEERSYRVAMTFDDQGTRTGERTQASVNSFDGVAIAWKDTAPSYRVELFLDELSTVWHGPALFVRDEGQKVDFYQTVERTGRATSVVQTALLTQGMTCSLRVRPAFGPGQNCRAHVRCGEVSLYGGEGKGFNQCAFEGNTILSARDTKPSNEDSDPTLDLDLPRRKLVVGDTGTSPWSITFELDPEKR